MSDKSFFKEIVDDVYPSSKTSAFYDIILIVLAAVISCYIAVTEGGGQRILLIAYIGVALVAGIKYCIRRGVWGQGGCLAEIIRIALCFPIGLVYAPFMFWFAIKRLKGDNAPLA